MRAILAIALPTVALGAVATHFAPPQFTAESVVRVEPIPQEEEFAATVLRRSSAPDAVDFRTHVRLIASPSVAKRVIAQLEPGPELLHEPASLFELAAQEASRFLPKSLLPPKRSNVHAYAARLGVHPHSSKKLVRIAFTTGDPARAAQIANAHARAYMEVAPEQQPRFGAKERRLLEIRAERATAEVQTARSALDSHRSEHDIATIEARSNEVITRLSRISRRHLEAESKRQRLEDEVRLIEEDRINALPAVTANDLIWHLKESVAQLEAQRVRLQADFRPDDDQLGTVEERIRTARQRLGREIASIVGDIKAEYDTAMEAEQALREELDEQKALASDLENAVNRYAQLERDLIANQRHEQELQEQLGEVTARPPVPTFQFSIAQHATVPEGPSYERPTALAVSLLLGISVGLALAFLTGRRRSTFETIREVEYKLGLPTLGALPDFRHLASQAGSTHSDAHATAGAANAAGSNGEKPELALIRQQGMDAFREIQGRILASTPSESLCSLLFTGATSGAGNTSVALNIAALLSQQNRPVLVIDANFRGPRCHEVLHAENGVGLSDVLCKRAEPHEAIRGISEHLFLLPAGPMPPDPTALLASTEMAECLIQLQKHYAYIVVDGPPLAPASDSLLLCPLFDGVILVADQPSSARAVIQRAAEALNTAKARTLGIVVNRVPSAPLEDRDAA